MSTGPSVDSSKARRHSDPDRAVTEFGWSQSRSKSKRQKTHRSTSSDDPLNPDFSPRLGCPKRLLKSMADPFPRTEFDKDAEYYAITLTADSDGKTTTGGQTHWVGFADEAARIEIRELSLVEPTWMADHWECFSQPYMVVTDTRGFYRWFLSGGHALITLEMTEMHMPWELEPRECVQQGFYDGFTSVSKLPQGALNRAPTPKVRMQVLKRDGYRCRLCGRRPADYVDVELHVHHIRPYANRGVSTEPNLVALCHTCHNGLEPHYEIGLFSLINPHDGESGDELKMRLQKQYLEGVNNYRESMKQKIAAHEKERREQACTRQPSTRSEADSESGDKHQT